VAELALVVVALGQMVLAVVVLPIEVVVALEYITAHPLLADLE
jgi:hypothetical protein